MVKYRLFLNVLCCSFGAEGKAFHDGNKTACKDEVEYQGEYGNQQYGTSDVVSEGDEDDTCTYFAASKHSDGESEALLE